MKANKEPNPSHELAKEINAAEALRKGLEGMTDDKEVIADTMEGATNLHEMMHQVLVTMIDDKSIVDGCAEQIKRLGERKKRAAATIESKRALITQALLMAGKDKLPTPTGTPSLTEVKPGLVVTNEADIPSKFFKTPDPVLDRTALLEAINGRNEEIAVATRLKDANPDDQITIPEPIPGATLDNGGVSLRILGK